MKNFDNFVNFINTSNEVQKEMLEFDLKLENRNYNLTNPDDLGQFIAAIQNNTLRKSMRLLRYYHEWINQNE